MIAMLAKRFRAARSENAIMRNSTTQRQEAMAYERLCWMIDAEHFGWNPEEMEECVELH
jgi:hypothetical protein